MKYINNFALLQLYFKELNPTYKYLNVIMYDTKTPFTVTYTHISNKIKHEKSVDLNLVDFNTFIYNLISQKTYENNKKK